jgi:hypothetical protein
VPDLGERFGMVSAMSVYDSAGRQPAPSPSQIRGRAYAAVQAVLSDDHNYERGVEAAWAVAKAAFAEFGAEGLAPIGVELSLELASALEWLAVDQEITAVDLADVWFVDCHADD